MSANSFVNHDPYLEPFRPVIDRRIQKSIRLKEQLLQNHESLKDFANGHLFFGRLKTDQGWVLREWAPNATAIQLVGARMGWNNNDPAFHFIQMETGFWELRVDHEHLQHLDEYKLLVSWNGGQEMRLSPWTRRVVQDDPTKLFSEQVWDPPQPYTFKENTDFAEKKDIPLIYEAHIGMSSEREAVSTYDEFRTRVLPYIHQAGYNTIQLMAVQEHPYYGSFGYHVSSFFAPSSRFGTPDDLKRLIDEAHGMGLQVIMDIVHSHAVKNTLEGPGLFDGKPGMFFHTDHRREHPAWDSLCFDYGKQETVHFLLSNCKYWLDEFRFDGFRFDGVTSMLYFDHGLERSFSSYDAYFDQGVDEDALSYLMLANQLMKEVNSTALSIAEDMSGMPGLAIPADQGGIGFDYRLAMGIPDFWIRLIKEQTDESWNVSQMYYELTNKRSDEKVIAYAESHDQALVGDKTLIFRLADKEMYTHMSVHTPSLIIDRAMALHKIIRLITLCTNGGGYLNFMGNEFGHPEWIDFPREGNNWSFAYARRQWSLMNNPALRYQFLSNFDQDILNLFSSEYPEIEQEPQLVLSNQGDQVLAFQRGTFYFLFNFNPVQSFSDYGVPCPAADYKIMVDSDHERYGGFNRIDEKIIIESEPISQGSTSYQMKVYLPNRTAIVLKQIPTPSIRSHVTKK